MSPGRMSLRRFTGSTLKLARISSKPIRLTRSLCRWLITAWMTWDMNCRKPAPNARSGPWHRSLPRSRLAAALWPVRSVPPPRPLRSRPIRTMRRRVERPILNWCRPTGSRCAACWTAASICSWSRRFSIRSTPRPHFSRSSGCLRKGRGRCRSWPRSPSFRPGATVGFRVRRSKGFGIPSRMCRCSAWA